RLPGQRAGPEAVGPDPGHRPGARPRPRGRRDGHHRRRPPGHGAAPQRLGGRAGRQAAARVAVGRRPGGRPPRGRPRGPRLPDLDPAGGPAAGGARRGGQHPQPGRRGLRRRPVPGDAVRGPDQRRADAMTLAQAGQGWFDPSWVGSHLDDIRDATVEHLLLTGTSVAIGIVVSLLLALVALRWRWTYGVLS